MKDKDIKKEVVARPGAKRTGGIAAPPAAARKAERLPTGLPSDYKSDERILAPIPGVVTQVFVAVGQHVAPGEALLVIEAMKMKNTLRSGHDLDVKAVHVHPGETIQAGRLLVEFDGKNEKGAGWIP